MGGQGVGFSPLATNDAYDPTADAWTTKAPMSNPRYGLAAETLSGLIYAFGGSNGGFLPVAEVYDPVSNAWFPTAPMLNARYGLVEGAVNNTIYAIGGYNGLFLATNEQFNPSKLTYLFKKN
jgi:Kelch motif